MIIRLERKEDEPGIRQVNDAAFGGSAEAQLVDALRGAGAVICSLVADEAGEVIGHILFSPATLSSHSQSVKQSTTYPNPSPSHTSQPVAGAGDPLPADSLAAATAARGGSAGEEYRPIAALGPMAVLPAWQKRGVGSQLVRTGLEICRAAGYDLVIVLGHTTYYPRFGFQPAPPLGIRWEHGADAHFMVLELRPGALAGATGVVRYRPEFDDV